MPLASVPFEKKKGSLNSIRAIKIIYIYNWVNTKISLELGICQCVQICKVFRVTPTLFDGDYFWHTKHEVSQSGMILLHFEWAILI